MTSPDTTMRATRKRRRGLWRAAALAVALNAPGAVLAHPADPADMWPQWRGPLATGVAPRGDPPTVWSEERNVRWKVEIPGAGHSTPIVWGNRIYLTTAIPLAETMPPPTASAPGAHDNVAASHEQDFVVLALERGNGRIVWRTSVRHEQPHESMHETASWASASPVTDGKRLYAFFGSRGLFALDLAGRVLWQRDLGDMAIKHGHGEGSSPALFADTLVVNWDQEEGSFVVALDARTGKDRWRAAREEATSWSTPIVVEHAGRPQVVIAATRRIRSYDLATGALLWQCGGLSDNVVATPVAGGGMVYAGSSYEFRAMIAIRLEGARGDLTGTDAVAWALDRNTPYVPSPLLDGDTLFFLRHNQGLLSAVDAASGRPRFPPERLPGVDNVFASPVSAAGRVYVVGREGKTAVVRRTPPFELLAVNALDDRFIASPAIAGRELYLRGRRHLYAIASAPGDRPGAID